MASLLGCRRGGQKVSRCETYYRRPDLDTVMACEAIFGVPAKQLFFGMFRDSHHLVAKRAKRLSRRLRREAQTPAVRRKLALLDAIITNEKRSP